MAQLAPKATWPDAISTDFSTLLPNGRLGWHVWEQHRTAWITTRLSMPRLMNWRRNWRQPSIATRCSRLRTMPHERAGRDQSFNNNSVSNGFKRLLSSRCVAERETIKRKGKRTGREKGG